MILGGALYFVTFGATSRACTQITLTVVAIQYGGLGEREARAALAEARTHATASSGV